MKTLNRSVEHFDFRRYWDSMVTPHLNDPEVLKALDKGRDHFMRQLNFFNTSTSQKLMKELRVCPVWELPYKLGYIYEQAIPPGRKPPKPGTLEWYQPFHCCHFIADFVLILARKMFPSDKWFIQKGEYHSTVTNKDRTMVLDILLFEMFPDAAHCLAFAGYYKNSGYTEVHGLLIDPEGTCVSIMDPRKAGQAVDDRHSFNTVKAYRFSKSYW